MRVAGRKSAAVPATVSDEPDAEGHWETREGGAGSDPRARRPAVERHQSSRPAGDPGMERDLKTDEFCASAAGPAGDDPAATPDVSSVTIIVCNSCRGENGTDAHPRPGSRLVEDTRRAAEGSGVAVRQVGCLGNCKRGISAAMLRDGCWSYVFGGLGEDAGSDLVAGALLFAGSTDGFMPFRARPESLRRGLVARIPTIDFFKEDR